LSESRKSVAIIGTRGYPSYYGGFETAVRRLAPYLVDHGWDVTVYGRDGSTKDDDPARDHRVDTVVTRGLERKSLSTLTYGLTAARHAARSKPDVALVMNVANGYWLPILRRANIPTLVNVDGIEWDRDKWGRLAKAVFHGGAKWAAKYGTRMVYDSTEIARRWGQEFKLDGDFIPYGGDIPGELPVEHGLTHRGYVLVVARFVPENSIAEFFSAVPLIADKYKVVIVGSSGYGGEFDQQAGALAETHSGVSWLGHVSDDQRLLALWQHAGAYYHGHSVGGTNPALVQAMACGAPTIARDTPYNREVLGQGGLLFQPTVESIVHELLGLLSSPDEMEKQSALLQERAKQHYSWDGVSASYLRSLDALRVSASKTL